MDDVELNPVCGYPEGLMHQFWWDKKDKSVDSFYLAERFLEMAVTAASATNATTASSAVGNSGVVEVVVVGVEVQSEMAETVLTLERAAPSFRNVAWDFVGRH